MVFEKLSLDLVKCRCFVQLEPEGEDSASGQALFGLGPRFTTSEPTFIMRGVYIKSKGKGERLGNCGPVSSLRTASGNHPVSPGEHFSRL